MNNLTDLFVWLAGPGAIALVAWFVSWVLNESAAWQQLKPQTKSLLILLIAAVIGAGATYVIQNPSVYAPLEPYGKAILAVIGAWLSTQVAYRARKDTVTNGTYKE